MEGIQGRKAPSLEPQKQPEVRRILKMDSKLQSVVDTFDAVILQLQQKAGGHLWLRSPRIEEGRRRMGEELPRHQVIPCWTGPGLDTRFAGPKL